MRCLPTISWRTLGRESAVHNYVCQAFYNLEFNRAFVQMEYFGYLRRDPDPAGYAFWLGKLNQFGNYIDAELVKSFIISPEYRSRFGQP